MTTSAARRRIGVFTATRAEYGLLHPVLMRLEASAVLEPVLIVSGSHLSDAHGATEAEILADGHAIAARIPAPVERDDPAAVAGAMAAVLTGGVAAFAELQLDALILLGDRTELLAAAAAATVLRLPIVHLEGGHITEGAVDDAIRHAITKLAALHFTSSEPYRARILQMGEDPDRVFTVGSTGVDNLKAMARSSRAEVAALLDRDLEPGFILATWHPETLGDDSGEAGLQALLAALGGVEHLKIVFTAPNLDVGHAHVRQSLDQFAAERPNRVHLFESLGRTRYLAALSACEAVVGNSSSGVIEAPALGVPAVNVGDRQKGRLRSPAVIDCAADPAAVAAALRRALDPAFRAGLAAHSDPLADGRAAERIVAVLEQTDFAGLSRKMFVDRP